MCFQNRLSTQFETVKLRLHLIDSLYSTQMSKRHYGIEELGEALALYSDEQLLAAAAHYVACENCDILETLFAQKYGYNSVGMKEKKAVSLISKYLYFLTAYQFPIYDSLVKISYREAIKEFEGKAKYAKVTDANFVHALSELNQLAGINNFEKLDNYLWYSQKLNTKSYSLILSKEEHIKKLRQCVPKTPK